MGSFLLSADDSLSRVNRGLFSAPQEKPHKGMAHTLDASLAGIRKSAQMHAMIEPQHPGESAAMEKSHLPTLLCFTELTKQVREFSTIFYLYHYTLIYLRVFHILVLCNPELLV